jgi:RimJ/RimL family protein N-acetyltransferase
LLPQKAGLSTTLNAQAGMMHVLVETERLILRRFTERDGENLFRLDSDPEVMRFLSGGARTPHEVISAKVLPRFLRYDERFPGFGFWAALEKASGDFIGWFSFNPSHVDNPYEVNLGFRLRRAVWGKGYATEGARALIWLGFTEWGVERVLATTYQDNIASRRVMEKLGMKLTRTFRMTAADLERVDTYHTTSQELWDGEDLEYTLHKADWEQQKSTFLLSG